MDDVRHPLFVPVRCACAGAVVPLTARLPQGPRVGLAFTSREALEAAVGPGQDWIRLTEAALRGMLSPLGIARIQVDPVLVVADVSRPVQVRNVPHPAPATATEMARG